MSKFSVHRTADTIPALRYCLVLDGERIAGGKPDYRGNNHLISWSTRETYGPVDQLKVENAKLRELIADMLQYVRYPYMVVRPEVLVERARKLGIEVSE